MRVLTQAFTVTLASTTLLLGCGGGSSAIERVVEDIIVESQEDFIRAEVQGVMEEFQVPGVSLALIADKRVVYSEGFGLTHLDAGNAVTADTSFWLGSVSKAVMGVALMRAQEQGVLSLDDHVPTLLANDPQVNLSLPHTYPMVLRDLVTHTSGIIDSDDYSCAYFVGDEQGEYYSLANALIGGECDESAAIDLGGYLNNYLSDAGVYYSAVDNFLTSEPGSTYRYSNIASALAGYTLEAASGVPLDEYANIQIFSPLQMNNTSWRRSDLAEDNIATPYIWDDESEALLELPIYDLATWPDGGLRSSANDLAKLLLAIMYQGEQPASGNNQQAVQILQEDSVITLLEPASDSGAGRGLDVGVFWMTTETQTGRELIGHEGSDPGAYSFMFFDPIAKVGVVMMGNGDDEITPRFDGENWKLIENLLAAAEVLGDM
jgi:CubicO group peptidase (beta-lactamase class C family)